MDSNAFKAYQPMAYMYIKNDYHIDTFDDDEESLPSFESIMSSSNNKNQVNSVQEPSSSMSPSSTSCVVTDFKTLFKTMANDLKEEMSKKKTSINLSGVFRCIVCFESNPSKYMACFQCGRFLGCFNCISKLDRCPLCRKMFQCTVCTASYPKKPLFIPGLNDFISDEDEPEPSSSGNNQDEDHNE